MYISSFIEILQREVQEGEETVLLPYPEPVLLADAKVFCAIDADYTGDDALLESFIKTARQGLEKYLNLALIPQKRTLETDREIFELPYSPIIAIESVKDKDGSDVEYEDFGTKYPKLDIGSGNGVVTVTYNCGFETVEDDLQTAIKLWVRGLYDKDTDFIDQAKDLAHPHSRNFWI